MTESPLLSIITVNLNNQKGLKETVESLKKQSFTDYEHIIIDGGSEDASVEYIAAYAKETDKLSYWISEKDSGVYDGMNKGIDRAKGKYLFFLNSGDYLRGDILHRIDFDGSHYICGDVEVLRKKKNDLVHSPQEVDLFFLSCKSLPHQACFIHSDLFRDHRYDINYSIVSDWIHAFQTLILESHTYRHIPLVISYYQGDGISSSHEKNQRERELWFEQTLSPAMYQSMRKVIKLAPVLKEFNINDFYECLRSDFYEIIPLMNKTSCFQKRAKKLVLFLYRVNNLFSKHK